MRGQTNVEKLFLITQIKLHYTVRHTSPEPGAS